MFKFYNKKTAFTLAEAMMFLLIATLVMVAAMPVITRKHVQPIKLPHGKWVCMKDNSGNLRSLALGDGSVSVPEVDSSWTSGCTFPQLPESVKSIMVKVVGGGAAGATSYWKINRTGESMNLFPDCEGKKQNDNSCVGKTPSATNGDKAHHDVANEFIVDKSGKYELFFKGDSGQIAKLSSYMVRGYNKYTGTLIYQCDFDSIKQDDLDKTVSYVKFIATLKKGDIVGVKYSSNPIYEYTFTNNGNTSDEGYYILKRTRHDSDMKSNFNNGTVSSYHYCNDNIKAHINYNDMIQDLQFAKVVHTPGNGGYTKTFYVKRNGVEHEIAKIKGGSGSFFHSDSGYCAYNADAVCDFGGADKKRYMPTIDQSAFESGRAVTVTNPAGLDLDISTSSVTKGFIAKGEAASSTITSTSGYVELVGGCGGAAGQANVDYMVPPKNTENMVVEIGDGGTEKNMSGGQTRFAHIVAEGGNGCSPNEYANGDGGKGGEPDFVFNSSRGGEGARGGKGHDLPPGLCTEWDSTGYICTHWTRPARDGQGVGAGGGGASIYMHFYGWSADILDPPVDSDNLADPDSTKNHEWLKMYIGEEGAGSSGGIVVTW